GWMTWRTHDSWHKRWRAPRLCCNWLEPVCGKTGIALQLRASGPHREVNRQGFGRLQLIGEPLPPHDETALRPPASSPAGDAQRPAAQALWRWPAASAESPAIACRLRRAAIV